MLSPPQSKEPQSSKGRGIKLEKLKFVESVIELVHSKTLQGGMRWKCDPSWVQADPTSTINVTINFNDEGPDSAIWESVVINTL
jgi:hypothetical protein